MLKRLLFPVKPDGTATSAILLIARIVFGILLMNHGIQKWTNFQELSAVFPVELEIGVARKALSQAMERVRLSENSLAKAEENEAKAIERYNEGKVSVVEVIDAQTYRQTSQVNYVQAKAAAQGHYSELIKALHGYDCR